MTIFCSPLLRKLMFWVWCSAIWIGSLIPLSAPPVANGDKFEHFFGYAVLAILAWRVWPRPIYVWLGAAAMGIAVEFAQSLTPWRTFDVLDMLANAIGALSGVALCLLAKRLVRV